MIESAGDAVRSDTEERADIAAFSQSQPAGQPLAAGRHWLYHWLWRKHESVALQHAL